MHLPTYLTSALALLSTANALSIPDDIKALVVRNVESSMVALEAFSASQPALERRKGGGGKGGGGGGGGGGGAKSGGGAAGGKTSSTSNVGGQTKAGSGVKPAFGGGKYYAGGAAVPFAAGTRSPSGITPTYIPLVGFYPGLWPYGAYYYPYGHSYNYHNRSANSTHKRDDSDGNVTISAACLCQAFLVCGCDDNTDPQFIIDLIGDGNYSTIDKTVFNIVEVNGTLTLTLNGTLANGTTASGGVDDAAGMLRAPYQTGMWLLAAVMGYAVMSL